VFSWAKPCDVLTLKFRCLHPRLVGECVDVARGKRGVRNYSHASSVLGLSSLRFSRSSIALGLHVLTWLDFEAASSVYVVC